MAHILDLPSELLNTILIILAMSCNGPRDLARASAACKMFMTLARRPDVLKVVNFQSLSTNDYAAHHHTNDLLCQCVQAGNLAAESMLGKALLLNDTWFWNNRILQNHQPLNGSAGELLWHQRLVRSFICNGSREDIAPMRIPLFSYMISFLGYDAARASGILVAITNMCTYELIRLDICSLCNIPDLVVYHVPLDGSHHGFAHLTPPPGLTHRDNVLLIFDKVFPSSPV